MKRVIIAATLTVLAAGALLQAQAMRVDAGLPAYQKASGVSGNINSVGSDTMNNMMTFWAEIFQNFYRSVKIQIEGKGSTTAPVALISGTAQLGPMSREMRQTEIDQFEVKYGYKPVQLRTSYDALAVYINKDNPIEKLTLAQVEAIFSKTRKRGYKEDIKTWGQLGLTGDWANKPISLYGRNAASGTYGFFKEFALKNGDYKTTVKEQPGSASVVQGVETDRYGIGYSGIGYKTSGVKIVPIAETDKAAFSDGSYADVQAGKYPLSRFLFIYVNKAPSKPLDPLVGEFIKLIFSKEGQEQVVKDGYYPLSAAQAAAELAKVQK